MEITVRHGDDVKIFDIAALSEMQLLNMEFFLKKQKDDLFAGFLDCTRAAGSTFERYHEIKNALRMLEDYKL